MKASELRKMQRAIISSKSLRNRESERITKMQDKVYENYDVWKAVKPKIKQCHNWI